MSEKPAQDSPAALPLRTSSAQTPPLSVRTVPVPAGYLEPMAEDIHHTLDFHLGQPTLVTCHLDGRTRRDLQIQGHCSVLPAGAEHSWQVDAEAAALLIHLTPSFMRDSAEAMGLSTRHADLAPTIRMRDPGIERLGWILQAEHLDGNPNGRLFSDGLACALAARLLTLQSGRPTPERKTRRALPAWRLRRVVDYIEANLDRDLNLAELAGIAGFSPSHFKPLFKQAVGMPAHRFVLERRVARAQARLLEGEASLADIASESGFAHASHMARCMRRLLGLSPTQIAAARR